jgi:carbon-monoxide dehydrogenase medium subunit
VGVGTAFRRVTRVAVDLAKVNAAVVLLAKNGVCEDARIAVGGLAPTPMRVRSAEAFLRGTKLEDGVVEQAARMAADETKPVTDIRSTKEYRKELCKVLVKRALKMSWELANKNTEK